MDISAWPMAVIIAVFIGAGLVIALVGTRLAGLADRLADRTGLGEAVAGAVFLGLVTSLPGLATSVAAALAGRPALAISNALGGIAVQTAFIALADMSYRKANLEHAVASLQNIIQVVLLIALLSLVVLALASPDLSIGPVHAVTPLIPLVIGMGMVVVLGSGNNPMWRPRHTGETVPDIADEASKDEGLLPLMLKFLIAGAVVMTAGVVIAHTTGAIADRTGLSESVAGALLSGVVTSMPELVTSIAAVRRGALTLAVGDIIGGNVFDVIFISAVDIAYFSGSAYSAPGVGQSELFLTGLIILLNAILLLGLLYRQRRGPGNIGLESVLILITYVGGFIVLINTG